MSSAVNQLDKIIKKIEKTVKEAVASKKALDALGQFTTDLIVKRTRLGYGVKKELGDRYSLKSVGHTAKYTKFRASFDGLDSTTSPKKQNLTLTGQLLRSMKHEVKNGVVVISPTGDRDDSKSSNLEIAEYQVDQGRVFNKVSRNEFKQILRYYRKTFGDLLRLRGLLR